MATKEMIESFCRRFTDVIDSHGKYKAYFVENVIALYLKKEKEEEEESKKTCDNCAEKHNGLYSMECFSCKRYNVDKWRAK